MALCAMPLVGQNEALLVAFFTAALFACLYIGDAWFKIYYLMIFVLSQALR